MTPPPNLREFFDHQAYNRMKPSTWQPNIGRVHAVARALILLANGRCEAGLKIARENKSGIERVDENLDSPRELAGVLLQELQESLALHSREESVFKREGEYWSIIYQGQLARLKATRGLYFLARLLRQPRREFHVSELIAEFEEIRVLARVEGAGRQKWGTEATTVGARSFGPLLDAQAKAEYRRRLQDLG